MHIHSHRSLYASLLAASLSPATEGAWPSRGAYPPATEDSWPDIGKAAPSRGRFPLKAGHRRVIKRRKANKVARAARCKNRKGG